MVRCRLLGHSAHTGWGEGEWDRNRGTELSELFALGCNSKRREVHIGSLRRWEEKKMFTPDFTWILVYSEMLRETGWLILPL